MAPGMDDHQTVPVIRPVILAGGLGSRLWPMVRADAPKHLLRVPGETSLFEQTLARVGDRRRFAAPLIVCGAAHAGDIETLLDRLGQSDAQLIVEPEPLDTAPAVALAVMAAQPGELLLVMPSDHHVADPAAFLAALGDGREAALGGAIVTFGIEPVGPETGFGYLAMGAAMSGAARRVERFIEKPERAAAERLLAAGGHAWNAGLFLARAAVLRAALAAHAPQVAEATGRAIAMAERSGRRLLPDAASLADCPAISFDHAVMERAADVAVVPVSMGWSDVGNWASVHAMAERDGAGNSVSPGSAVIGGSGNLIRSDGPPVVALGVEDLAIIVSGGAVLVTRLDQAQRVREAAAWATGQAAGEGETQAEGG